MMTNSLSASDVALLSGSNNRANDGFGWGGDGAWWIIILFLFVFCGWGNGGWGFGGNRGNGTSDFLDSAIQRGFDNQAVISKLDGINNGLCDGFYAMNTGMLTGFNGIGDRYEKCKNQ